MYNRPDWKEYFLTIASDVAKRSTCIRRQYGSVIVKNNKIISTGYNGSPSGEPNCCDNQLCNRQNLPHNCGTYSECHSVHSEQNAIIQASKEDMQGATLYLFGWEDNEPIINPSCCPICQRMVNNAGIKEVVVYGRKN